MSNWVSVKNYLPGDMQDVVLADFNSERPVFSTAWMDTSGGLITNDFGNWTHWMSLPDRPTKADESTEGGDV